MFNFLLYFSHFQINITLYGELYDNRKKTTPKILTGDPRSLLMKFNYGFEHWYLWTFCLLWSHFKTDQANSSSGLFVLGLPLSSDLQPTIKFHKIKTFGNRLVILLFY